MTGYVQTIAMTGEKLYRPNPEAYPDSGYLIYQDDGGRWSWLWQEPGQEDEFGPKYDTRADALRGVAQDWADTGDSGQYDKRFIGMLRALSKPANT